ncbi:MAG: ribosome maturation factor RimM [Anaerolineae bacterium]|nr:ribosome maturation factor RimM [Anaerolineae bacterium]MDW8299994.1 ribosome maturation factor RimM [Anaerolineae bacterium]
MSDDLTSRMPILPAQGYLTVARVARPHGIRGALRVQALTSTPQRMGDLVTIYLSSTPERAETLRAYTVARCQHDKGDQWLMFLEGVESREAADRLRGQYILVTLQDAVPLAEDEIYLFQVIGLTVVTAEGTVLGRVVNIIETGANDVYVVHGELYGEVLIPAIESVVRRIDVENGVMHVTPLPGLLPDS